VRLADSKTRPPGAGPFANKMMVDARTARRRGWRESCPRTVGEDDNVLRRSSDGLLARTHRCPGLGEGGLASIGFEKDGRMTDLKPADQCILAWQFLVGQDGGFESSKLQLIGLGRAIALGAMVVSAK